MPHHESAVTKSISDMILDYYKHVTKTVDFLVLN